MVEPLDLTEQDEQMLQARDYQEEILERALNQNVIIYLPTGAGKTFITVMAIKRMSKDLANSMRILAKSNVYFDWTNRRTCIAGVNSYISPMPFDDLNIKRIPVSDKTALELSTHMPMYPMVIFKFESTKFSIKSFVLYTTYIVSPMFNKQSMTSVRSRTYHSRMTSLILTMFSSDIENELIALYKDNNIEPNIVSINEDNIEEELGSTTGFNETLDILKAMHINGDINICYVLLTTICLFIGKRLNEQGYQNYFTNRWNSLYSRLGEQKPDGLTVVNIVPESCIEYYIAHNADFNIRRLYFDTLVRFTASARTPLQKLIKIVIQLFSTIDMNHIILINTFILTRYQEILALRCLRDMEGPLEKAIAFLSAQPEDKRLYVRFYKDEVECEPLNRRHFELLSAAARVIAKREDERFGNYKQVVTKAHTFIEEVITAYLNSREKTGAIGLTNSCYTKVMEIEKKFLYDIMAPIPKMLKESEKESEQTQIIRSEHVAL